MKLAGRQFHVRRSFVEDAEGTSCWNASALGKALLVMHAPRDAVGIDNASKIFLAAKHPKSFVSLDDADRLRSDAASRATPPSDRGLGIEVRPGGQ